MKPESKFLTGLFLGAITAAGLAYFLTTPKGKNFVADLKIKVADLEEKLKNATAATKDEISSLLEKSKTILAELEKKMSQYKES
jgi:ElaB/YqjD/DUF883 family membrane-anchored ribosome-binding protein